MPTSSTLPESTSVPEHGAEVECFEDDDGDPYTIVWEVVDGKRTRILEEGPSLPCTGPGGINGGRAAGVMAAAFLVIFPVAFWAVGREQ